MTFEKLCVVSDFSEKKKNCTCGEMKGGLALSVRLIETSHKRALFQEPFSDCVMAMKDRPVQRVVALMVGESRVGAKLQQQQHLENVSILRSTHECGKTPRVRDIEIRSSPAQHISYAQVAFKGRPMQRCLSWANGGGEGLILKYYSVKTSIPGKRRAGGLSGQPSAMQFVLGKR